jgi:hypothetical protein
VALTLCSTRRFGWRAVVSGLVAAALQGFLVFWASVASSLSHLLSNVTMGAGEVTFMGAGLVLVSSSLLVVVLALIHSRTASR